MGKLKFITLVSVLIIIIAAAGAYLIQQNKLNLLSEQVSKLENKESMSVDNRRKQFADALKAIQEQSKATFFLKDTEGNEFETHFYSSDAIKKIAIQDDAWAGIDVGDTLFDGHFKLAFVDSRNQQIIEAKIDFPNYQYNVTRKTVYVLPSNSVGQPDIIGISTIHNSNYQTAKLFYIRDGQFKQLKVNSADGDSEEISYSARPKTIGKNLFQTMDYSNAGPVGFSFLTYQLNLPKNYLIHIKTKDYFDNKYETGQTIYQEWLNDKDFIVN